MAERHREVSTVERWARAALACFLGALLVERISGQGFFDPDGYHQMAVFRRWLRAGSLPVRDPFAFTHTVFPSVHHEWGAGAVLYALATAGGAPAVMAARWILSAIVAVVAAAAALRRAPAAVVAFAAPAAILLAQPAFTTIRAELYTMLFLAVVLVLLDRDRDRDRPWSFLLAYLPLVAVWINLHAGWIVGAAAVLLHAAEQALRRRPVGHLAAALLATAALTLATPYGRAYPRAMWHALTMSRDLVTEWAPLVHSRYVVGLGAYAFAVLLLVYAVARRGPRALRGLTFVVAAAVAAWLHQRHVALFALAWFAAVPGYLAPTPLGGLLENGLRRPRVAAVVAALSVVGAAALLIVCAPRRPFRLRIPAQAADVGNVPVIYPTGAVAYLRDSGFHGRLVTSFLNGGFVLWKLHPAALVSFDGRYEAAYAPEVPREDRTIHGARPGWRDILLRYAPDAVLVERGEPLAAVLPGGLDLVPAYRDDVFEVWARPALGLPRTTRTGQAIPVAFP